MPHDYPVTYTWQYPPPADSMQSTQARWHWEPDNARHRNFLAAHLHVKWRMNQSISERFPDCEAKLKAHVEDVTLKYFHVDSPEKFDSLLKLGQVSLDDNERRWRDEGSQRNGNKTVRKK